MSAWNAITDSRAFRRFASHGPGRRLLRSRGYRRVLLERHRLFTRPRPGRFDDVGTFCCFIGHTKSGASMVGGLLDAHPEIVVSDEWDILRYVEAGFGRSQVFALIERGASAEARKGRVTARRLEPYSYQVPGGAQGHCERPRVVGDSTSGAATRRLAVQPELLGRLCGMVAPADVRLLQVIRNPFDPISVMIVRGRRTFSNAIDAYFAHCELLAAIRRRIDPAWLLEVRHEDFVADAERQLGAICRFLGIVADNEYLGRCRAVIRARPDRSRELVMWTPRHIAEVERRIRNVDFLEGYGYDSH